MVGEKWQWVSGRRLLPNSFAYGGQVVAMKRRGFLVGLGASGLAALAGCGGSSSNSAAGGQGLRAVSPPKNASLASDLPTAYGPPPRSRTVRHGPAVRADGVVVSGGSWAYRPHLQYAGGLLTPTNGVFLTISLTVANDGRKPVPPPKSSAFAYFDTQGYAPKLSLPDGVSWADVEQAKSVKHPLPRPTFAAPETYYYEFRPDSRGVSARQLVLLFDVPQPSSETYLRWASRQSLDQKSSPVFLPLNT